MAKETYRVYSNPYPEDPALHALFAGHSQTRPGHQVGPRVFDYFLIHSVLSGKGVFVCGDRAFELAAGDSFVIEPGKLVYYASDTADPWRYRWLAFQGREARGLMERTGLSWSAPVVRGGGENRISDCLERIEGIFAGRAGGGDLKAKGCLLLMLGELEEMLRPEAGPEEEHVSKIERQVRQAARQLTAQYAEPVSVERLAESMGYNRAYFSKMFKKYNHAAPAAFLLNLRVSKARQLLRERPELTVEQIAHSVGFNDPLYFSKQFKRFYGMPPRAYRKSLESMKESGETGR